MRERGIHHNDAADGDGLERPTVVDVADAALQGGEAVARLDAPPRLGAEDGEFGQDARALLRRARPDIRVFTSVKSFRKYLDLAVQHLARACSEVVDAARVISPGNSIDDNSILEKVLIFCRLKAAVAEMLASCTRVLNTRYFEERDFIDLLI